MSARTDAAGATVPTAAGVRARASSPRGAGLLDGGRHGQTTLLVTVTRKGRTPGRPQNDSVRSAERVRK
ncbi:hypothetical protein EDD94_5208 [Streptomyces sp. PanSC9]|nr:hypothetical protein EDD94_5208 [Streptomyces sp. PanSC9]